MVITKNQAVNGAKAGGSIIGGSIFLGPILGPLAGGVAASKLTGKGYYATAGVGAAFAGLLLGGGGGSGAGGSHTPAHARGFK